MKLFQSEFNSSAMSNVEDTISDFFQLAKRYCSGVSDPRSRFKFPAAKYLSGTTKTTKMHKRAPKIHVSRLEMKKHRPRKFRPFFPGPSLKGRSLWRYSRELRPVNSPVFSLRSDGYVPDRWNRPDSPHSFVSL